MMQEAVQILTSHLGGLLNPMIYSQLGDQGVATHNSPGFSILVRAIKDDALAAPTGYRQRWNDAGSASDNDVSFNEPECPRGYRVLGYATIQSNSTDPSTDDIDMHCVKDDYVVQGDWEFLSGTILAAGLIPM